MFSFGSQLARSSVSGGRYTAWETITRVTESDASLHWDELDIEPVDALLRSRRSLCESGAALGAVCGDGAKCFLSRGKAMAARVLPRALLGGLAPIVVPFPALIGKHACEVVGRAPRLA